MNSELPQPLIEKTSLEINQNIETTNADVLFWLTGHPQDLGEIKLAELVEVLNILPLQPLTNQNVLTYLLVIQDGTEKDCASVDETLSYNILRIIVECMQILPNIKFNQFVEIVKHKTLLNQAIIAEKIVIQAKLRNSRYVPESSESWEVETNLRGINKLIKNIPTHLPKLYENPKIIDFILSQIQHVIEKHQFDFEMEIHNTTGGTEKAGEETNLEI